MKWTWIRTPILLMLAGACALVASRLAPTEASRGTARRPLVPAGRLDPERVDRIVVERGDERFEFVRDGDRWRQRLPIEHALDSWSIRQLIAKVRAAEVVRELETRGSPSPSGAGASDEGVLGPTLGRIEFSEPTGASAADRAVTVVELGRRSLGGRAFARLGGDAPRVAVVDGSLHDLVLDRDMREFRRRDLFADIGEIENVTFQPAGGGEVVLSRRGRGFEIESPVRTRADRSQGEDYIAALRRARSEGFVVDRPREPAVYGLAPPAARLVVAGDSETTTLLVGEPVALGAQDRFAMIEGSDTVFRLPAATLGSVIPRTERLIDATAAAVRPSDVARIEIDLADRSLRLDRGVDGWRAERLERGRASDAIRRGTVEAEAVDRLLATLTDARAGRLALQPVDAARVDATVTLRGFAGEPLATIRRAPADDGVGTVLDAGDGVQRIHGAIDLPIAETELGFRADAAP